MTAPFARRLTIRPTARAFTLPLLALAALATAPPATSAQNERGPSAKARASASESIPIRYYNAAPRSAEFVDRAVRAWNRALVGSHFRAVPRRDARVVIRAARPSEGCGGLARIRGARTSRRRDTLLRYSYQTSAVVTLGDALEDDVLLADHLDGEPLSPDHGAPLRLVSPAQYGYINIKHLCRIRVHTSVPRRGRRTLADVLLHSHPRARVWEEERHGTLPGRLVRPVYGVIARVLLRKARSSGR